MERVYKMLINGSEKKVDVELLTKKVEAMLAQLLVTTKNVVVTSSDIAEAMDYVVKKELCGGAECNYAVYNEKGEALNLYEVITSYSPLYLVYNGKEEGFYVLIPPTLLDYLPERKRKKMLGYVLRVVRKIFELYEEDELAYCMSGDEAINKIALVMCRAFMPHLHEQCERNPLELYYSALSAYTRYHLQT